MSGKRGMAPQRRQKESRSDVSARQKGRREKDPPQSGLQRESAVHRKGARAGILLALLAAALYAVQSPFSKILLDYMSPTLMAGFLYLGAGIGMGAIALRPTLLC